MCDFHGPPPGDRDKPYRQMCEPVWSFELMVRFTRDELAQLQRAQTRARLYSIGGPNDGARRYCFVDAAS